MSGIWVGGVRTCIAALHHADNARHRQCCAAKSGFLAGFCCAEVSVDEELSAM